MSLERVKLTETCLQETELGLQRQVPIDLGTAILSDLEKDSFFGMAGTEVRLKAMWEGRTSVDEMFK